MFDHISKHLEVRQKYSAARRNSTLFSVFGNVVKYGLSCLIHYLKQFTLTGMRKLNSFNMCSNITATHIELILKDIKCTNVNS